MAATPAKNTSVVVVRPKSTIALPPATLGFGSLIEPDDTFNKDRPKLNLNAHYSPEGIAALAALVTTKIYSAKMIEDLKAAAEKAGLKLASVTPQPVEAWLESKLKEPKDNAVLRLPHITVSADAWMERNGEKTRRVLGCWDAADKPLDLAKLRVGRGSIIEPIVFGNLYYSKLIGFPQPTFKLVGVRILKLVQWGGARAPAAADDEAIKAVMGEGFKADDLSAYGLGSADHGAEAGPPDPEDVRKDMF